MGRQPMDRDWERSASSAYTMMQFRRQRMAAPDSPPFRCRAAGILVALCGGKAHDGYSAIEHPDHSVLSRYAGGCDCGGIDVAGANFFLQERLGRFGAPFRIIKFRSMFSRKHKDNVFEINGSHRRCEADYRNEEAYPLNKETRDPRITPVGRIIRKLSLDELPQLFNVLFGDMSLVGPRPIVEAEAPLYGNQFAYYDLFRPGITGLWQVSGRSDVGFERRVLFDREYASEWSCLLDWRILTRTIPAVVTMRGAY